MVGLCLSGLGVAGANAASNPAASPGTRAAGQVATAAVPPTAVEPDAFAGTGLEDADFRTGSVAPSATQKTIAKNLGANVVWNRFGTPASLINYGGYLATGLTGSNVDAARSFLRANAALFRLTTAKVNSLKMVNDSTMTVGGGRAVTFRQRFGDLSATQDGMIIVGIKGGKVAYVSSSVTGNNAALGAGDATLTAKEAWLKAAQNVGFDNPGALGSIRQEQGWSVFPAEGLVTPLRNKQVGAVDQRVRLVALPTYTQGVRAAYETVVLHNTAGDTPAAYVVFVDAANGNILFRQNAVDQFASGVQLAADSGFFTGTTGTNPDDTLCGPKIPIQVELPTDKRIDVVATADVPADDIVIVLYDPTGAEKASSDTLTSPEALDYELAPGDVGGEWYALVCEFEDVGNFTYSGFFQVSPAGTPPAFAFPPQWNYFTANPALPGGEINPPYNYPETDNRTHACWTTTDAGAPADCELDLTPNVGDTNLASRVPWDHNVQTNTSTFQTYGNNAETAESWFAALTPGATAQRPINFDRTYGFLEPADPQSPTGALEGWTNQWNRSGCNPVTSLTPAGNNNDVMAATTTLNAGHNRYHDFAYNLGFTERNYNMQVNNFGNTAPGPFPFGRELDPEIGNVQNGAALPASVGLTRNNANQITLQDGIPGITNQYLFQPIAGAFYAPCADGDLDGAIYGHEYTHAISNRMVGGPDSGLSGAQAGAMGESWSDQVAVEYLNAYDYVPTSAGENPFAVGIYATGNKDRAIRNYGMNRSPLNYSNIGYDMVCTASLIGPPVEPTCQDEEGQVHADGEIWSATGYEIRQALVQKYNGSFPYGNAALQARCADGNLPADKCPGNRRWIQLMFDAFLLQQGGTDMLMARDAYLAADQLRFNGANRKELWRSFARRGMGSCSSNAGAACHATRSSFTQDTADDNPRPSFESPLEGEKTIRFVPRSSATGEPIRADIFVGRYEARSTPIADTKAGGPSDTAGFVPGTYDIVVRADGYGHRRFRMAASGASTSTLSFTMAPNFASAANGAVATGDGANQGDLIDDTEATTWDVADTGDNVDVARPDVTVDLMGTGSQMVRSVRVSALLTPTEQRFTALRQFAIQACNAAAPVSDNCSNSANFETIYTSPANAFDAEAPRPVAPDLLIKAFDVTDTPATHVRLVALDNQCTGAPDFQGDQDNDPATADTDCSNTSARASELHVAELQVLASGADGATPGPPGGPKDPVVALTKTGPLTAAKGSDVLYDISYTNLGPATASSAKVVDTLPAGVVFVRASNGGTYNATTRKVTWNVGNVALNATGTRSLVVRVPSTMATATLLLNQVEFMAPLTVSTPGAFVTAVQ